MLFFIVSLGVPLVVYFVVPRLLGAQKDWKWLLLMACIIFFVSWYLPSPLIDGKQTQFMTHFVGGGIFTGLLWLYVKFTKKWRGGGGGGKGSLLPFGRPLGGLDGMVE